jgi:hypothetical protein
MACRRTRSAAVRPSRRRHKHRVQATQHPGGPRRGTTPTAHATADTRPSQPGRSRGRRSQPPTDATAGHGRTVHHASTTGRAAIPNSIRGAPQPPTTHQPRPPTRCPSNMRRCPPLINGIPQSHATRRRPDASWVAAGRRRRLAAIAPISAPHIGRRRDSAGPTQQLQRRMQQSCRRPAAPAAAG